MRSTVATLLRVLNNNAVMVEAAGGDLSYWDAVLAFLSS